MAAVWPLLLLCLKYSSVDGSGQGLLTESHHFHGQTGHHRHSIHQDDLSPKDRADLTRLDYLLTSFHANLDCPSPEEFEEAITIVRECREKKALLLFLDSVLEDDHIFGNTGMLASILVLRHESCKPGFLGLHDFSAVGNMLVRNEFMIHNLAGKNSFNSQITPNGFVTLFSKTCEDCFCHTGHKAVVCDSNSVDEIWDKIQLSETGQVYFVNGMHVCVIGWVSVEDVRVLIVYDSVANLFAGAVKDFLDKMITRKDNDKEFPVGFCQERDGFGNAVDRFMQYRHARQADLMSCPVFAHADMEYVQIVSENYLQLSKNYDEFQQLLKDPDYCPWPELEDDPTCHISQIRIDKESIPHGFYKKFVPSAAQSLQLDIVRFVMGTGRWSDALFQCSDSYFSESAHAESYRWIRKLLKEGKVTVSQGSMMGATIRPPIARSRFGAGAR